MSATYEVTFWEFEKCTFYALSPRYARERAEPCAVSPVIGTTRGGDLSPDGTEETDDVGSSDPVRKDGAVGVAPASLPPSPSPWGRMTSRIVNRCRFSSDQC